MNPTDSPRVSIVLPVRDGARYLHESLESVRDQTLAEWELIAVDDGSTDATAAILADAAERDTRIRVLRNDPPRRLPGALNRGFEFARGEYWTWTSDDNAYRSQALARMVAALEAAPRVGVVYADYTVIDEAGREVARQEVPDACHLGYSNVIGPCFLYRREVARVVGPYAEDLMLAEDYDFWLRAAGVTRFAPVHADLYRYRTHRDSLSATRRSEVPAVLAASLERNLPSLPRRMRLGACARLEDLAMARGDARAAARWRRRALRTGPLAALRRRLGQWRRRRASGGSP